LPIAPYAASEPLYGIVWPILISVAVTPGVFEVGALAAGASPSVFFLPQPDTSKTPPIAATAIPDVTTSLFVLDMKSPVFS
jgi:hypothetical protein